MSRIGKKTRQAIEKRAQELEIRRLDFIHDLSKVEEIDAIVKCIELLPEYQARYEYAKTMAPKNRIEPRQRLAKALKGVTHPREADLIHSEFKAFDPLRSETLHVKDEFRDFCDIILSEAGIGKKRRAKIIPLLIDEMTNRYEYTPEDDEDALTPAEMDLIEKLWNI